MVNSASPFPTPPLTHTLGLRPKTWPTICRGGVGGYLLQSWVTHTLCLSASSHATDRKQFLEKFEGNVKNGGKLGGVGVDAPFGEGVRLGEVDGVLSDSDGQGEINYETGKSPHMSRNHSRENFYESDG